MGGAINFNAKRVIIAFLMVLCLSVVFSQDNLNEEDYIIGETTIDGVDNSDLVNSVDSPSDTSTVWLFVRMIFALILVIAIIYVVVFFLKKVASPKIPEQPFLKRAATLSLGPGKSVHVITMPDKAWLVGVSEAGIQPIGEITDTELVTQLILEAEKQPSEKPKDFASIFNSFMPSAKATENTLKKQRDRLKNGGLNE